MTRIACLLAVSWYTLTACESRTQPASAPKPDAAGECTADIGLSAVAPEMATEGGVTVFGTTRASSTVTIRAVFAAGVAAPRDQFNFRSWSADISAVRLKALAHQGLARIPVIAFTSVGCQELAESAQPVIRVGLKSAESQSGEDAGHEDDSPDASR